MDTLVSTSENMKTEEEKTSSTTKSSFSPFSPIKELYKHAEFNRFGIISGALIIVGCLGGITVGFGAVASIVQLALVVFSTMLTLSMILAVAPMKWILNLTFTAIAIDVVLMIINSL
jgi:hypothetical protein